MTASRRPGTAPDATSDQDDLVLLARVVDADNAALRELYDRHGAWLHARLMRRCNDAEVVADVLQDTFVTLWKDARKFRGDSELAGWLWGIAFRRLVSRLRSLLLTLRTLAYSRAALHLEILALRHQLQVLQRTRRRRLRVAAIDRRLWVLLSRIWTGWRTALVSRSATRSCTGRVGSQESGGMW